MKKFCYFIIAWALFVTSGDAMTQSTDYRNKPDSYWQKVLPADVYHICRQKGTEKAGSGKYDNFYEKGTYYCACCGGDFPLFRSDTKFDSKTGWPSFWDVISPQSVQLVDETNLINRFLGATTEVRCNRCGSHLGHVFDDGPTPTGKRYCMNSLALVFVQDGNPIQKTFSIEPDPPTEQAIFAGGCFWCESEVFDDLPGIISVVSGYTGGNVQNPTYEQVSAENTGHVESVQVTFDPKKITYDQLLEAFWHNIDPFDANGQFCDQGNSYRAAIFYTNDDQKKKAYASRKHFEERLKQPIVTEIREVSKFYPAEDYHQQYAKKNPVRYSYYRWRCGRDNRLAEVWKQK